MKTTQLYTVRITAFGYTCLVGNFTSRKDAGSWVRRIQGRISCSALIETGGHSLCSPQDYETLIPR